MGVLAKGDLGIEFIPPLKYAAATSNPLIMGQYVKVFYQFESAFWDDNEFIVSLKVRTPVTDSRSNCSVSRMIPYSLFRPLFNQENEIQESPEQFGECHQWQNLDAPDTQRPKQTSGSFLEGSRILFCTLMTEEFERLQSGGSINLMGKLLDPLRRAYANFEPPINAFITDFQDNDDLGNGAYSAWASPATTRIEFEIEDYYKFYGGGPFGEFCDFNGCNCDIEDVGCDNPERILYISGKPVQTESFFIL